MNSDAWEATGGSFCSKCGAETVRLFDGVCLSCNYEIIAEREQKQADKAERRYYQRRLTEGTISLAQMMEGRL